jgi:hypothetical protein
MFSPGETITQRGLRHTGVRSRGPAKGRPKHTKNEPKDFKSTQMYSNMSKDAKIWSHGELTTQS